MYQKYYTDALVLRSRESGEADRYYALYTEKFGLVRARASAIRTEASRMRYALQSYSRSRIALVRGKHSWRVVGGTAILGASKDTNNAAAFARIAELTMRLVQGEEENAYLFAALAEAHDSLMREACYARATIEMLCVARILHTLGYISSEAHATLFAHTTYAAEELRAAELERRKILTHINRAIEEAQL